MNQFSNFDFNQMDSEENFDFKKEFIKYFSFWKYFLGASILLLITAFIYLRYTSKVYTSTAKIKVLDKKESSFELPSAEDLFSHSKINLENEVEILKSYPILEKVVGNLNLTTSFVAIGDIMESLEVTVPFEYSSERIADSITKEEYRLSITDGGLEVIDYNNDDKTYLFKEFSTYKATHDLPFEIHNIDKGIWSENYEGFDIIFQPINDIVASLKKDIIIESVGKESEIISLSLKSTNKEYAENVINELIKVFNKDGIQDRQLIHKRTIDFVNDRYAYLSMELDSIEIVKQLYKVDNNLVDLSANSAISLEQSFRSEENIFSLENQISVTNLLISTLNNSDLELLPANIGIENAEINSLISDYNQTILERKKLILSAGLNNPSIKQMDNVISDSRSNIIFSLQNHLSQLNNLKEKLSKQYFKYDSRVSDLPEKEKILRAIERNQEIKEALYLFLLQKREEAEVSYAVTEPSIKVVEYAITDKIPVSPKPKIIYLGALLLGLLVPFGVLYLLFLFDTKIYSKDDLLELNIGAPIVAEIPEIVEQSNKMIESSKERSVLAESFRVLSSNLNFILPKETQGGKVIMNTSTVKGEGKTFSALNLALTYSSFDKKVLLIGADLHNPQIHKYINVKKTVQGLTNFLMDKTVNWEASLLKPNSELNCDILLGGTIPPNPAQLLSNGNLDILLEHAKSKYDYIIIDTPPSLLVSDTLTISHLADVVLFVTRCNHSDKEVLNFIKDLIKDDKIKNIGLVLNGLGKMNAYGYGYGYGYGYRYSYNYGYGYGYNSDDGDDPS
jgi:capsular exopolysaccharide synthesis family protein